MSKSDPELATTYLVSHGADATIKDRDGRTVTHRLGRALNVVLATSVLVGCSPAFLPTYHTKEAREARMSALEQAGNAPFAREEVIVAAYHPTSESLDAERITPDASAYHWAAASRYYGQGAIDAAIYRVGGFGLNVNAQDIRGRTPLHESIKHGARLMARILLNGGADPNIQDAWGSTALHIAVIRNDIEMIQSCIKYGADVGIRDEVGNTAADLAVGQFADPAVLKILMREAAETELTDWDSAGNAKLHRAVLNDDYQSAEILLEAGADIEALNEFGENAMDLLGDRHRDDHYGFRDQLAGLFAGVYVDKYKEEVGLGQSPHSYENVLAFAEAKGFNEKNLDIFSKFVSGLDQAYEVSVNDLRDQALAKNRMEKGVPEKSTRRAANYAVER